MVRYLIEHGANINAKDKVMEVMEVMVNKYRNCTFLCIPEHVYYFFRDVTTTLGEQHGSAAGSRGRSFGCRASACGEWLPFGGGK